MPIIIMLILIINVFSLTDIYYENCYYGTPKSGLLSYSECNEYANEDSFCCLLYFVGNSDKKDRFQYRKSDDTNKELRKLGEDRVNLCIGITEEGYDNIKDVIKELEQDTEVEDIHILCFSRIIKFSALIAILLFLV